MAKVKRINYKLLKDTIKKLDGDKKALAEGLFNELTFMKDTLEKLKEDVETKGTTTLMCQGKYDIERCNPSLQSYNALIKNYNSTSKQLFDMLPKNDNSIDDFDDDDLL